MNRFSTPKESAVFVYGTLRRGFSNHSLLQTSRFAGKGRTEEPYSLWMAEYPRVCRRPATGPIRGELYLVAPPVLKSLDILEDHPRLYRRELIRIVPDGAEPVPAWMYFAPIPLGVEVPSGDIVHWYRGQGDDIGCATFCTCRP